MNFDLFKVQKTSVDIDLEKLYQTIKEEMNITPEEYDEKEDYCYDICNHFSMNETEYLTQVCGVNFEDDNGYISEPYYDIEANDITLVKIYDAFEDYVYGLFDL